MSYGGPGYGPPGHHPPPPHLEHHHDHHDHHDQHESYGHASSAVPYGHSGGHSPGRYESAEPGEAIKGTVYYIFSEADDKFNLAVDGNHIVVSKSNPSDPAQQWIKDESWSNKAKDSAGMPGFALINKATGKALARPKEAEQPVYLTTYHQKTLNSEYLWALGKDEGHGYHALRPVDNVKLNLDIDHGTKKYGGVTEGKKAILFTWKGEDNQKWQLKKVDDGGHHHHFHL